MRKYLLPILLIACLATTISAQNISELPTSINADGNAPDSSAILDLQATDKGLLIPRMDMAARDSLSSPALGLLIFQTDSKSGFYYFDGAGWASVGADVVAVPDDELNISAVLNGTNLELVDAGGTLIVDLSALQDGVEDADADPTNEVITNVNLLDGELQIMEGGTTTTVDLSSLADIDWLKTDGMNPTSIGDKIYRTGYIGIGAAATNPTFPLDVRGTGGERLRAYSEDDYYAGYLAKNSTREFFMGVQATFETSDASSGFHIYDNTANTQRFVIDKDGDIGIGEANPNAKLHVKGDVRIVDGTQGAGKVLTSDVNGFASWQTSTDLVDDADADPTNEIELPAGGNNGQILATDGNGNYSWSDKTLDTDTQLSEAEVDAFVGNNGYITSPDDADADPTNEVITNVTFTNNQLQITEGGTMTSVDLGTLADEDWSYDSGDGNSGDVYHTGKVSVGATSATNNGADFRFFSQRQGTDAAALMGYNGTSRGMLGVWGPNFPDVDLPFIQSAGVLGYCPDFSNNHRAAVVGYTENTQGNSYAGLFYAVGANAQPNIALYANAANSTNDNYAGYFVGEKSYFSGKIGIGNNQPATPLDVNGTILAGAFSSTMNNPNPTGNEGLIMPGTTSDYTVSVQDGNGRVQQKWNATNGTNETFLVGNEDAFFIDMTGNVNGDNDAWLEFKFADGANAASGDPISWTSQMLINQGGEVGINETSPDDMLHVTSGGDGTRVRAENTGNGWAGFVSKNTIGEMFVGVQGAFDANPGEFHFYDNVAGARRMVIDASGNVGIGRNNPSEKLDVNGDIQFGTSGKFVLDEGSWETGNVELTTGSGTFGFHATGANTLNLKTDGNLLYTGTLSDVSDRRLKENIKSIENPLERLQQIKGYTYNLIADKTGTREYGVMAQDVQTVFPEMVSVIDEENGYLGVSYVQLVPVLVEATKDLNNKIKDLEAENARLKAQVAKINQLEAAIQALSTQAITDKVAEE